MNPAPSQRLLDIDHVQLPIPIGGSPAARAFYQSVLGLAELRDPALDRPGSLRFRLGAQRLDLSEGTYTGVAPQAHVALRAAQLRGLAHGIENAGHRVEVAPLANGDYRIFVEDPFGNRIELIEPVASRAAAAPEAGQDSHVADARAVAV